MPVPPADLASHFHSVYQHCMSELSALERWPGYYKRRYLEFLSYYELLPKAHYGDVLELGCGNGYQSAFLAGIADRVMATDLPEESFETHTPGMHVALKLHEALKIGNVSLKACSAEALPFGESSFDLVYASHVVEHIPDQKKALSEIYRVLRPGGIFLCIVPTSADKVYALFNHYTYLIQRSFVHLGRMLFRRRVKHETPTGETSQARESAKKQLSHFPFPPPHGYSNSFLEEWRNWTPSKWRNNILNRTSFRLLHQSTSQFNPLLPVLGSLWPSVAMNAHQATRKGELKYGKYTLSQRIGVNTILIFVKP